MEKVRYFVGYPKPRLRPAPLLLAILGVIVAHPATARLAAAALLPLKKLDPQRATMVELRIVEAPQAPFEPGYICVLPGPDPGHHRVPDDLRGPDKAAPPVVVPAATLENLRIAGRRHVPAPLAVRERMAQRGQSRTIGVFKVCVDAAGRVDRVVTLHSTGDAEYDRRLTSSIHRWRYRPYWTDDGFPVRVCTAITFIHEQR